MDNYLEIIKKAWKDFVENGNLSPFIKPIIAESWQRCKKYGVDPMGGVGKVLSKELLELRIKENEELISIAHPIMENIYSLVAGSGFVIILVDKDGYLIDVIGDEEVMEKAVELNFVKGALWTEKAVGTNAIGTSLYIGKPVQVIGAEHYCITHHSWTCSAAPIHDEEGNIIGCLDMFGSCHKAHSHTLGIVLAGAYSIEKQLALIRSHKLINATFDSISEGMIITDENLKVKKANDMAANIIGLTLEEILKVDIKDLLRDVNLVNTVLRTRKPYYDVDCNFYVKGKRIACSVNAVPVISNKKTIGIVITFREAKYIHDVVSKVVGYTATYRFEDIITKNEEMKRIIESAKRAALSDCNILIEGDSGTGKELFAQAIHNYSRRAHGPFVAVNCASLPRELVESELFGYEKGAFTGASKEGHPGKFELADGGTIFLDEIGELPLDLQSKLLRVLDNKRITRIGGKYEKILDVRIIAATNRNLREEVERKNFRGDLYYRLNVINIKLPRLVDRKEDIELLANYFLERLNRKNFAQRKRFSPKYIEKLINYDWPGNVRELQNAIERSYYLCEGDVITEEYLPDNILHNVKISKINLGAILPFEALEKENVKNALLQCKGNVDRAAELLNVSRATIYRKIRKYKIDLKSIRNESK
ncbi:MAG: sigma-54-dependent Fis family transcriptional regulator [Thermosediminibacteraceae bacterium]|nr:sigma-54-dependent Fis family transcriptional regulator [Thermosediminibacteraceae bacterium]